MPKYDKEPLDTRVKPLVEDAQDMAAAPDFGGAARGQSAEVQTGGGDQAAGAQDQGAGGQAPAQGQAAEARGHDHDHDHEPAAPEPGDGEGANESVQPDTDALWQEIVALLQTIPLGVQALERKESYGVTLSWFAGVGRSYLSSTNNINLGPLRSAEQNALSFVHEMNHAHYHHAGLKADIRGSRDAYVEGKLLEESEGTVMSIRAKMELEAANSENIAYEYPLESEYRAAHQAMIAAGEHETVAQQAGLERVIQGFRDGEVVTSVRVNGQRLAYPAYYGRAWDRANPTPAGGGG